MSQGDVHDLPHCPTLSPDNLLSTMFVIQQGGDNYCAKVVDKIDNELDKYLVKIGDSGREEILKYNDLIHAMEKDAEKDDPEVKRWIFKEIVGHCCIQHCNKVEVLWEDNSRCWEPLSVMKREDPVTCAEYAFKNNILHLSGWRSL